MALTVRKAGKESLLSLYFTFTALRPPRKEPISLKIFWYFEIALLRYCHCRHFSAPLESSDPLVSSCHQGQSGDGMCKPISYIVLSPSEYYIMSYLTVKEARPLGREKKHIFFGG